jgi:hypothetical protein
MRHIAKHDWTTIGLNIVLWLSLAVAMQGCGEEGDSQHTTITDIDCIVTLSVDEYVDRSQDGEGLEYVEEPAPGYVTVNQCQDITVGDQENDTVVISPDVDLYATGESDA